MGIESYVSALKEEAKKYPKLTVENEAECIRMAQAGDESAKARLIYANWLYILRIAQQFKSSEMNNLEDLFQEGVCGLMTAINLYNGDFQTRFLTYAGYWIEHFIRRAFFRTSVVSIPFNATECIQNINKARNELTKRYSREPTSSEIAQEIKISEKTVQLLSMAKNPVSMEAPVSDEDDSVVLKDMIASNEAETDSLAMRSMAYAQLEKALHQCLRPNEEAVIRKRYALGKNKKPMTLTEVAKCYGVTQERIRQIEKRAIEKLRSFPNLFELITSGSPSFSAT